MNMLKLLVPALLLAGCANKPAFIAHTAAEDKAFEENCVKTGGAMTPRSSPAMGHNCVYNDPLTIVGSTFSKGQNDSALKQQVRFYVPGKDFVCLGFHASGLPLWNTDRFDVKEKLTITCQTGSI